MVILRRLLRATTLASMTEIIIRGQCWPMQSAMLLPKQKEQSFSLQEPNCFKVKLIGLYGTRDE